MSVDAIMNDRPWLPNVMIVDVIYHDVMSICIDNHHDNHYHFCYVATSSKRG